MVLCDEVALTFGAHGVASHERGLTQALLLSITVEDFVKQMCINTGL